MVTNDREIANILNKHFATTGEKLAGLLNSHYVPTIELIDRISPTVMEIEIQEENVKENLLRLNTHKATGPDDLPPILLKAAAEEIAPSLTDIFQTSARTATLPSLWKVARIAAAYKKDDDTDRDNYRPLSMLCTPSKLMEKEVHKILVHKTILILILVYEIQTSGHIGKIVQRKHCCYIGQRHGGKQSTATEWWELSSLILRRLLTLSLITNYC